MSQRSITSFFAKANETKDIRKNESSPEKHTDKKRVIEDEEKEEGISPRPSKKAKLKSASPTIKKKNEVASISPAKLQKSSNGSADQTRSSPVPEMDNKKLSSESKPSCTKESNTKAEMKVLQIVSDEEILNYNPSKKKYHPVNDAFWTDAVPYIALSRTFQLIEENSSRLKMMEILANFFRSVIVISKKDLLPCVYLCLNQLAPAYEGIELGVAETTLMKAIANTTGRSMQQIKSDSQKTGDLGIVAEESKSKQKMMFKPAPLTVANVFARLKTIASMTGNSAMSKKTDLIQSMLVACRQSESKYLIRSLAGKLRIGLAEQSLLQSLAIACTMTPPHLTEYTDNDMNRLSGKTEAVFKEKVEKVSFNIKTVYSRCPSYDRIIPVLLRDGVAKLAESCIMVPGVPLKPMLALPTKGVTDVFNRFDDITFTCEWKYDGERAQIHIDENGAVSIYSRNSENNTKKYPDIIQRIESVKTPAVKSCILDTEAVAWDKENKKILPFQVLSTRKRKDVAESEVKVQVCVYMFDLLYLNGKSLVEETFRERRRLLYENFKEVEGEWKFATKLDTSDMNEVQQFLEDAVKGNCEGLMIKTLETDATYEIAKRSKNWLKLKKDYMAGMGDSLDLVVVGGYRGKGKRLGTYGGFLLACYDSENEGYQTICKIGTGFSDDDLATHAAFFKDHTIPKPKSYYSYDNKEIPDEWFEPVQVWEIKCADLSISPVYKAALGIVDPEKGISLRFPRFIRIRDDKKAEDATNAEQIADMYNNQDQIKNQNATSTANDEDYY